MLKLGYRRTLLEACWFVKHSGGKLIGQLLLDVDDFIFSGSVDRRTAVDLALLGQSFQAAGTTIRWIPHPRTPADMMTKSDISKGNAALTEMLRTGRLMLLQEEQEMQEQKTGKANSGRSRAVPQRELS